MGEALTRQAYRGKIGVLPTRHGKGSVEWSMISSRRVGAGGVHKIVQGDDSVDKVSSMRRAGDEVRQS